ncbi:hypothetical protein LY76DRAFT_51121 [Colletotrichum caudatum]|nr:hypothetical protein LY76DRAFT_51121 [Colletotrichum caudatum]
MQQMQGRAYPPKAEFDFLCDLSFQRGGVISMWRFARTNLAPVKGALQRQRSPFPPRPLGLPWTAQTQRRRREEEEEEARAGNWRPLPHHQQRARGDEPTDGRRAGPLGSLARAMLGPPPPPTTPSLLSIPPSSPRAGLLCRFGGRYQSIAIVAR